MDEPRPVELPDGTVVWARVSMPAPVEDDFAPGEVGTREWLRARGAAAEEAVAQKVEHMTETIRGVADSVHKATKGLAPDEVGVEFGLELSGEPGHLVALLASGETRMTFKVSLKWHPGRQAGQDGEQGQEGEQGRSGEHGEDGEAEDGAEDGAESEE